MRRNAFSSVSFGIRQNTAKVFSKLQRLITNRHQPFLTEQELISGLKNRQEDAFRELVLKFQDSVFNTALGYVQNAADAEDVAQVVFIKIHRSVNQFKGESKLFTWIYRITVTQSLDFLRSKKSKKRFGFISSLFGDDNRPLHEPVDFHHPGVVLDRKEDAAKLFSIINKLPENQKTAFLLSKVEGLSYQEIADVMQVSSAAIESVLHRAKQNLRKILEKEVEKGQRFY